MTRSGLFIVRRLIFEGSRAGAGHKTPLGVADGEALGRHAG